MAKSNDVIENAIGSFGCWQALVCIIPIYSHFAVGSQQVISEAFNQSRPLSHQI